jgi:hypothetical protein
VRGLVVEFHLFAHPAATAGIGVIATGAAAHHSLQHSRSE